MASQSRGVAESTAAQQYVDQATDCAICLGALDDEESITLACGHRWHLRCIKNQLAYGAPNPAQRLLFSGCRCAKCSAFCDHPALADAIRSSAALRDQVDALIAEQMAVDGLAQHPEGLEYGRTRYAFYLCSVCRSPYFGGTADCADAVDDLPVADRVCARCDPATSAVCGNPMHVAFYEWKCRFCCRTATHVCYGTTHFCDSCHTRGGTHGKPEPLPCPGVGVCATPLSASQSRHENGPSHECEQVLRCTLCASDPLGAGLREEVANLSPNLLFNGDASAGLRGWHQTGQQSWSVETSEVQFLRQERNFVSSYAWCEMVQAVDLRRHLARPELARVQVSARYMARTDCPSSFVLSAAAYAADGSQLAYARSSVLNAPADFWEPVHLTFQPMARLAMVVVSVRGKDGRFWAGNFGSKATDISVRVVFDGSDGSREDIMRAQEVHVVEDTSAYASTMVSRFAACPHATQAARPNNQTQRANNRGACAWQ